jgi:hypothetical protein
MEADVSTPAAPAVRSRFRRERRCGLAPLFWQHILSSGEVHLDMTTRLTIASSPTRQVPLGSGDSTVIGYQGEVAARLRGAHRGAALSTSKEVRPVFPPRTTSAQRLRPRTPSPECWTSNAVLIVGAMQAAISETSGCCIAADNLSLAAVVGPSTSTSGTTYGHLGQVVTTVEQVGPQGHFKKRSSLHRTSGVVEPGVLTEEDETLGANWARTVFGDNDFGAALVG